MKSFSIGKMAVSKRTLSKKEQEEIKKKVNISVKCISCYKLWPTQGIKLKSDVFVLGNTLMHLAFSINLNIPKWIHVALAVCV